MFKPIQKPQNRRKSALLFSLLLACTLLLNACSSFAPASSNGSTSVANPASTASTPTLVPSPTVTQALQQQGTAQLQSFQQWIALLQQYGGKADTYQQQYASDQ